MIDVAMIDEVDVMIDGLSVNDPRANPMFFNHMILELPPSVSVSGAEARGELSILESQNGAPGISSRGPQTGPQKRQKGQASSPNFRTFFDR